MMIKISKRILILSEDEKSSKLYFQSFKKDEKLKRDLSSPSEGALALDPTFDRGRFSLLPFYPGWRSPIVLCSFTGFWLGDRLPGVIQVYPLSGN